MADRIDDVIRFYELLAELQDKIGGKPCLAKCRNGKGWGSPGVYFFFERGEYRSDSGQGKRVVRVGCTRTDRPLCERFNNHRTGGSHRNSQFRIVIGSALKNRDNIKGVPSWAVFPAANAERLFNLTSQERRQQEGTLEVVVSEYIESMPFLWLVVKSESHRQFIESNSILLLSNRWGTKLDPPANDWLGFSSGKPKICASGLWCETYTKPIPKRKYDSQILELLADHIRQQPPGGCVE
jgi:hypothetical protein